MTTGGDDMTTVQREIRIAAAQIYDDQHRTLLVRKAGSSWFIQAGGKIEARETPEYALIRELKEELNLSVQLDQLKPFGRFYAQAANEPEHVVVADVFELRMKAGDLHPHSELEEVIWVSAQEPGELPLAPLTRDHVLPLFRQLYTGADH